MRIPSSLPIVLLTLLMGMGLALMPATSTLFMQKNGPCLSLLDYGNLFILWATGALSGSYFLGILLKKGKISQAFKLSSLFFFLSSSLFALQELLYIEMTLAYLVLMTALFLMGLGFGMSFSGTFLLASTRPFSYFSLYSQLSLGSMLIALLLFICAAQGLWWTAPLVMAALSLATLGLSYKAIWDKAISTEKTSLEDVATNILFWGFTTLALLYGLLQGILIAWSPIFLEQIQGINTLSLPLVLALFWMLHTLGAYLTYKILTPSPKVFFFLSILLSLSCTFFAKSASSLFSLTAFLFIGLSSSSLYPMLLTFAKEAFAQIPYFTLQMLIWTYLLGFGLGSAGLCSALKRSELSLEKVLLGAGCIALLLAGTGLIALQKKKRISSEGSAL